MKDYKKILEGVVDIINTAEKSDIGFANICAYIGENCPELKESEDERIRKAIKKALQVRCDGSRIISDEPVTLEEAIAWFEKQDNKDKEILVLKDQIESLHAAIKALKEVHKIELEKQGEQKPTEEYNITGIGSKKAQGKLGEMIKNLKPVNEVLEHKPVDKVEPKFHEGDWIVHHGTENLYQVVAVIDNQYQLKYGHTYTVQKCADVDRCARLWDITKDAKAGDVLFTSSTASHETFIFKSIDERGNAECYFAYDSEDGFREGKYHFIGSAINCKPATKEQRDLLFSKMKEAGYEWDAEKKELKKIEQSPAWSEEDENRINRLIAYFEDKESFTAEDDVVYANWLKSLRPQSQWKPSEGQLDALQYVYRNLNPLLSDRLGWDSLKTLELMYQDLKKLRE